MEFLSYSLKLICFCDQLYSAIPLIFVSATNQPLPCFPFLFLQQTNHCHAFHFCFSNRPTIAMRFTSVSPRTSAIRFISVSVTDQPEPCVSFPFLQPTNQCHAFHFVPPTINQCHAFHCRFCNRPTSAMRLISASATDQSLPSVTVLVNCSPVHCTELPNIHIVPMIFQPTSGSSSRILKL